MRAQVLDLLERSQRTHDDLNIQLEHSESTWDCYLAFLPFVPTIAEHPLHEFRCVVSKGVVRCVAQYSHNVKCPINESDMPRAGAACAAFVRDSVMPDLPHDVVDAAIDVSCTAKATPREEGRPIAEFDVSLIEVNPLGPGCIWGVLNWDRDRHWLLAQQGDGKATPPHFADCPLLGNSRQDNTGNVWQYMAASSTHGGSSEAPPVRATS